MLPVAGDANNQADLYQSDYRPRPQGQRFPSLIEWALARGERAMARRILKMTGKGKRALELGCGRGTLLDALRDVGFVVSGTELNKDCIAACRSRGHAVDESSIEAFAAAGLSFDWIIAIHVLEHLPSLSDFCSSAERLVPPGGRMVLEFPNADSPFGRTRGWFGRDYPNHLHQIPARAFRKFMEQRGWVIEKVEQWSLKFGPYSIGQSMGNQLMPGSRNALYRFLQRPRKELLVSALLQIPFVLSAAIAYPATHLLLAPSGRGEIVRFWLRREARTT